MDKNNIINTTSFDCSSPKQNFMNVYKGTSFRFLGEWTIGHSYLNNDFYVDFVSFKGSLWACVKSNIASNENSPSIDNNIWSKVVDGIKGECYVPSVKDGKLIFTLSSTPSQEEILINTLKGEKGEDGVDGKDGVNGNNGINGKTYKPEKELKDGRYIVFKEVSNYLDKIEVDCYSLKGEKGDSGDPGKSWVFSKVETISIDSDKNAEARIIEDTPGNANTTYTLKLWIPKGAPGLKGDKGDPGESVKGEKGDPGLSPIFRLVINEDKGHIDLEYRYNNTSTWTNLGCVGGKSPKLIRVLSDINNPDTQDSSRRNDRILWGYDGLPLSEWSTLCYLDDLRGDENIWLGCNEPTMPDNKTPDLDKIWYDPCDKSIDIWSASDFIYQAYTEIGGLLTKDEFEKAFINIKDLDNLPIEYRPSRDQLGSLWDGVANKADQGIIWLVPSENPSKDNFFDKYIAVESPDNIDPKEYMWEVIGGSNSSSNEYKGSDYIEISNNIISVKYDILKSKINEDLVLPINSKIGYLESRISGINVPEWALFPDKPTYTAEEVGAIPVNGLKTIGGESLEGQGDISLPDVSQLQSKQDDTLETENKTIVGAINELRSLILNKS